MSFEYSNIELEKLLVNMMCLSTNNLEESIKNKNIRLYLNFDMAYLFSSIIL